MLGFN